LYVSSNKDGKFDIKVVSFYFTGHYTELILLYPTIKLLM